VYGPSIEPLKPEFLDEVRMLCGALPGPWAVASDFNVILEARDKNNSRLNRRSMAMFRRAINDLELKESYLLGRRYTWTNERARLTLERINRWFGLVEWDALFPHASLSVLSSLSDHSPILMSIAVMLPSKRRFHFERFWMRLDGFQEAVASSWSGGGAGPADPIKRLDFKLRRIARDLQWWSTKRVGSVREQILVANDVLQRLDVA
jgi:hypothetical protein